MGNTEREREIRCRCKVLARDLFSRKTLPVFIEMCWLSGLWWILSSADWSVLFMAHRLLTASAHSITLSTRRPRGHMCVCEMLWCSSMEESRSEIHVQVQVLSPFSEPACTLYKNKQKTNRHRFLYTLWLTTSLTLTSASVLYTRLFLIQQIHIFW